MITFLFALNLLISLVSGYIVFNYNQANDHLSKLANMCCLTLVFIRVLTIITWLYDPTIFTYVVFGLLIIESLFFIVGTTLLHKQESKKLLTLENRYLTLSETLNIGSIGLIIVILNVLIIWCW